MKDAVLSLSSKGNVFVRRKARSSEDVKANITQLDRFIENAQDHVHHLQDEIKKAKSNRESLVREFNERLSEEAKTAVRLKAMNEKYIGVKGVVRIEDESGIERLISKVSYLKMKEAGRKVRLLQEIT